MKKLILALLLLNISAFAQKGFFSFGYILPLGGSLPRFEIEKNGGEADINNFRDKSYFEWGILWQPSYNLLFESKKSQFIFYTLSFGLDIGYYNDTFSFINYNNKREEVNKFDSLNLGAYIETTIASFMIGVGGGVKIALGGQFAYDYIIELLNYDRLKSRFDNLYIPYIKFLIGIKNQYGFNGGSLSFYFNYDFPNITLKSAYPDKQRFASIDLGVQLGYYINFIPALYDSL